MLNIELVPSTSHFKNLRSELKAKQWDLLRRDSYAKAGHKCEVCGGKGRRHPVECHEIWEYKDQVQKLLGLVSLCPSCHEVKHIGLAEVRGRLEIAKRHLQKVNGWSSTQADNHIFESFEEWGARSKQNWTLDISWAYEKLKELEQ